MRATKVWASWEGKAHEALCSLLRRPVPQTVPGRIIDPENFLLRWNPGLAKNDDLEEGKKCTTCKELLALTEFYKDASTADGYKHSCKQCSREKRYG